MATLRIDLEVKDYDLWRTAFGKDSGGRGRHGLGATASSRRRVTSAG